MPVFTMTPQRGNQDRIRLGVPLLDLASAYRGEVPPAEPGDIRDGDGVFGGDVVLFAILARLFLVAEKPKLRNGLAFAGFAKE